MSIISLPFTFTAGATIIAAQFNSNFQTIYNDYNGNVTGSNLNTSASFPDTILQQIQTAGKVSGSALTLFANIPSGAGILPIANIGIGTPTNATVLLGNGTWGQPPYIQCTNTQAQGVAAGSTTSGSWQTVILNTKNNDTASIATLSANAVILPSGTYYVSATSPFNWVSSAIAQIRLFNSTASSVIITGQNLADQGGGNALGYGQLQGQFTLGVSSNIIIQYQTNLSQATSGLGQAFNFGPEVYATIELWKVT